MAAVSKLAVFQQQASVGALVTLRLTRGDDVAGRIKELDDEYVRLDLGGRVVTIFADILAGWELQQQDHASPATKGHNQGLPSTVLQDRMEEVDGAPQDAVSRDRAPERGTESTAPVASELARIEARFSEAVKRARLAPPEPDFRFQDEAFPSQEVEDARREWDRARSRYDYALKVKELI